MLKLGQVTIEEESIYSRGKVVEDDIISTLSKNNLMNSKSLRKRNTLRSNGAASP
jgi:hypothetical protein